MFHRDFEEEAIEKYKTGLKSSLSKKKIKERKSIVEHVFGTMKRMMGKNHFILCGKEKVQIEFDLYAMAYNLKRLKNVDNFEYIVDRINKYAW